MARLGAHHEAAVSAQQFLPERGEAGAVFLPLDLARHGAKVCGGEIDEVFADEGQAHAQPRALGADGRLGHLHHDLLPHAHVEARGRLAAGGDRLDGDIPRVEVAVFFLPEGYERRLHALQNVDDAPLVDVSGDLGAAVRVQMELDQLAVFGDGRKAVLAEKVKKHIFMHCIYRPVRLPRGENDKKLIGEHAIFALLFLF